MIILPPPKRAAQKNAAGKPLAGGPRYPPPLMVTSPSYRFDAWARGETQYPPRCRYCRGVISSNRCRHCGQDQYDWNPPQ